MLRLVKAFPHESENVLRERFHTSYRNLIPIMSLLLNKSYRNLIPS